MCHIRVSGMKTCCVRAQVWLIWCSARPANSLWKCPIRITRSVHCEEAKSFCSCVSDFSSVARIRVTRSVHCEQARSFCSCVYDFSSVPDPVFMLKRGSGLQGQFTVNKQGLSVPVLMIFSGVADPVFTSLRGSGLQGQFTV
jgi:hypothetical protein